MIAALLVNDRTGLQITTRPCSVGGLIFPQMDQIDFTGPFEVLSRMPDTMAYVAGILITGDMDWTDDEIG